MILREMRAAIETVDAQHEILADNIHASVTMDHYYDRPTDDWCVAREVDQYGISFYPKFLSKFTPPFLRRQTMTGAHSAAPDGRFAISEMQTHHATMFNPEGGVPLLFVTTQVVMDQAMADALLSYAQQGGLDRRQMAMDAAKAQAAAFYSDGKPAVLSSACGRGKLCYISTYLWRAGSVSSQCWRVPASCPGRVGKPPPPRAGSFSCPPGWNASPWTERCPPFDATRPGPR